MTAFVFDIETNSIKAEQVTKVHSLVIRDLEGNTVASCSDDGGGAYEPIEYGIQLLAGADLLIGHNVICYDLPILNRLYGLGVGYCSYDQVFDTLVATRLMWPDLRDEDMDRIQKGSFPPACLGSHSLKAWGHRIGVLKGLFNESTDWVNWSKEMQDYCEQDTLVTLHLYNYLQKVGFSPTAMKLEHKFRWIIRYQEEHGFKFDQKKATDLLVKLSSKRADIKQELDHYFPPTIQTLKTCDWKAPDGALFLTLAEARKFGWKKTDLTPISRTKSIPFNLSSRVQLAQRLMAKGWKPESYTQDGRPELDDETLEKLPYPEAKKAAEYFLISKRIAQLAEGSKGWLKLVTDDGRLHGSVITNGTVTGRCAHVDPNLGQVPSVKAPYGHECRELFTVAEGMVLVGCDASALELRCLGHYASRYDAGAISRMVVSGSSKDGTDIHTQNAKALGLTRDQAKTWIYAYLYGAGDNKLGGIVGVTPEMIAKYKRQVGKWRRITEVHRRKGIPTTDECIAHTFRGAELRDRYMEAFPAIAQLSKDVQAKAKVQGYLTGLDGRKLRIRSAHSALNTLLQSAGSILVKWATVLFYEACIEQGMEWGSDFGLSAHVHDEWQTETKPDLADHVGKTAVRCIEQAGKDFTFRCPLTGEFKIGRNWADTH